MKYLLKRKHRIYQQKVSKDEKNDKKDLMRQDFGFQNAKSVFYFTLLPLSFEHIVLRLLMDGDPCFELLNTTD